MNKAAIPKISLVITTYNWKEALSVCLNSIAKQHTLPYEVVVADDGSREDTKQAIDRIKQDFPVPLAHAWQEDKGFRAARVRNLGIAATQGDYIVFLDGDMLLHPDFVGDYARFARRGSYLQGGRLSSSEQEAQRLLAGGEPDFSPRMSFSKHLSGELKPKHARRIPWLAAFKARKASKGVAMSCNLGAWRDDLYQINGFDNRYEGWGREDDDLTLRLQYSGVERRILRYAGLAIHLWHKTRWPDGIPPHMELPNDRLLKETIANHAARCDSGLNEFC
jgi:glycosyltransferase involved in cell wall biosynthesis